VNGIKAQPVSTAAESATAAEPAAAESASGTRDAPVPVPFEHPSTAITKATKKNFFI
jgi:hypothetical protein